MKEAGRKTNNLLKVWNHTYHIGIWSRYGILNGLSNIIENLLLLGRAHGAPATRSVCLLGNLLSLMGECVWFISSCYSSVIEFGVCIGKRVSL